MNSANQFRNDFCETVKGEEMTKEQNNVIGETIFPTSHHDPASYAGSTKACHRDEILQVSTTINVGWKIRE